jgi:integrating conjugative element membrane protein (TIGR03747 family)
MKTELGWFSKDFTQSLLSSEPVEHMMIILNTVNQWLFIETGFNRFINQTQDAVKEKTLKVQIYFWCKEYVFAAIYMISTFTLRLVIFLLSMPLFLLAITIGVVDGLVRRDLRKYGCGYESGFIYHQSKVMIIKPLIASGMLYLALPFSIHPLVILLPSAVFQGISISITVGSFKKYI